MSEEPIYHFRVHWCNKGQTVPAMRTYDNLPEAFLNARAFTRNHVLVAIYLVKHTGHYTLLHQWGTLDCG